MGVQKAKLSDAKLLPLVMRAKQNDGEALEELIRLVLPEIHFGKYHSTLCDQDDQHQIARLEIWNACYDYDPNSGASFLRYVVNTVPRRIIDTIRNEVGRKGEKKRERFERIINFSVLNRTPGNDDIVTLLPSPHNGFERLAAKDEVDNLLSVLPPEIQKLCRMIYVDGLTQDEASRILGVSSTTVSTRLRLALNVIKARNGAPPTIQPINWDLVPRPKQSLPHPLPDSLTGLERIVAELQSAGSTMPAIAKQLSLSYKQVENALTRVRHKIRINKQGKNAA